VLVYSAGEHNYLECQILCFGKQAARQKYEMMVSTMDVSISSSHSFANFTYLIATKHFLNYTEYKKVTCTNTTSCMKKTDQATGQKLSL
jgi:hypothetical protein